MTTLAIKLGSAYLVFQLVLSHCRLLHSYFAKLPTIWVKTPWNSQFAPQICRIIWRCATTEQIQSISKHITWKSGYYLRHQVKTILMRVSTRFPPIFFTQIDKLWAMQPSWILLLLCPCVVKFLLWITNFIVFAFAQQSFCICFRTDFKLMVAQQSGKVPNLKVVNGW